MCWRLQDQRGLRGHTVGPSAVWFCGSLSCLIVHVIAEVQAAGCRLQLGVHRKCCWLVLVLVCLWDIERIRTYVANMAALANEVLEFAGPEGAEEAHGGYF
jgi:hypothetical protein